MWSDPHHRSYREVVGPDTRPPVLYLRPFGVDRAILEEYIVSPFRQLGPVVAIGVPTDEFKPSGATRIYTDEDWKTVILETLDAAQLVVMLVGMTPGVDWEFEQTFQHEPFVPTMLFLPLPFALPLETLRSPQYVRVRVQMAQFRERLKTASGFEMPEDAEGLSILHFTTRSEPRLILKKMTRMTLDERRKHQLNPYYGVMEQALNGIRPHLMEKEEAFVDLLLVLKLVAAAISVAFSLWMMLSGS